MTTFAEEAITTILPYLGGYLGLSTLYYVGMLYYQRRKEERDKRMLQQLGRIEGMIIIMNSKRKT